MVGEMLCYIIREYVHQWIRDDSKVAIRMFAAQQRSFRDYSLDIADRDPGAEIRAEIFGGYAAKSESTIISFMIVTRIHWLGCRFTVQ